MVNVSNILLKRLSCDVEQPIEVCLEIALFSPGPKTPVNARNTSLDSKNPGSDRADTRLRELAQRCEVGGDEYFTHSRRILYAFFVETAGYQRIYGLDPFVADHLSSR